MADDALDSHELSSFKELDSAASAIINSDQTPELSTEDKDGQSITHGNENDNKVAPAIIPSGGEPGDGPTVENANKSESDDHDEFYGHTPPRRRSPRKTFRRRARKIDEARNVGDYIEDLEMRVGSLEKEIIRLQRSLGIANAESVQIPFSSCVNDFKLIMLIGIAIFHHLLLLLLRHVLLALLVLLVALTYQLQLKCSISRIG